MGRRRAADGLRKNARQHGAYAIAIFTYSKFLQRPDLLGSIQEFERKRNAYINKKIKQKRHDDLEITYKFNHIKIHNRNKLISKIPHTNYSFYRNG
jgi:hypothetical protein